MIKKNNGRLIVRAAPIPLVKDICKITPPLNKGINYLLIQKDCTWEGKEELLRYLPEGMFTLFSRAGIRLLLNMRREEWDEVILPWNNPYGYGYFSLELFIFGLKARKRTIYVKGKGFKPLRLLPWLCREVTRMIIIFPLYPVILFMRALVRCYSIQAS